MVSHVLSAAINSLALELAHDGILVNAIGVSAVLTDNWAHTMLPAARKRRPEIARKSDASS